jgi:hypothetical protein
LFVAAIPHAEVVAACLVVAVIASVVLVLVGVDVVVVVVVVVVSKQVANSLRRAETDQVEKIKFVVQNERSL